MTSLPKEKPLLGGAGLRKLTTRASYHALDLLQARAVWAVWESEATRLFREFWQSGNQKHLRAFFTHVAAMRIYAKRATR
jgi:hypothetical protein